MTPVLAFDIETAPDCDGLRRLYDLDPGLSDKDVAEIAFQRRRAAANHDFLQLHQHRVIAIACALREGDGVRVWSLGAPEDGEAELIRRFFDGIEKYTPQLVSWNGGGFDLPVLHYRSLVHGICGAALLGPGRGGARLQVEQLHQPLSRAPSRPDGPAGAVPAAQQRAAGRDGQADRLSGQARHGRRAGVGRLPGGKLREIRSYCETDAANTYLMYLRFQLLRGVFDAAQYQREVELVRGTLAKSAEPHWREFLDAWK